MTDENDAHTQADDPELDTSTLESAAASESTDPLASPSRAFRPHGLEQGRNLAAAAAQVALDTNGSNVIVLDVSAQSAEFDFFVLATGTSRRQLHDRRSPGKGTG